MEPGCTEWIEGRVGRPGGHGSVETPPADPLHSLTFFVDLVSRIGAIGITHNTTSLMHSPAVIRRHVARCRRMVQSPARGGKDNAGTAMPDPTSLQDIDLSPIAGKR